jgi:ribosome maturation factor RimP
MTTENAPSSSSGRRHGADLVRYLIELVEPALVAQQFELVDIETEALTSPAATVRVFVDRTADYVLGPRIDLDGVADATRLIETVLDADPDVIPGRYSLEVSSPGLERPLRTVAHFVRQVGSTIAVRTQPGTPGERRVQAVLEAADDDGITVGGRQLTFDQIERARTVVNWGPAPKSEPGKPGAKPGSKAGQSKAGQSKAGQSKAGQRPGSKTAGSKPGRGPAGRSPTVVPLPMSPRSSQAPDAASTSESPTSESPTSESPTSESPAGDPA